MKENGWIVLFAGEARRREIKQWNLFFSWNYQFYCSSNKFDSTPFAKFQYCKLFCIFMFDQMHKFERGKFKYNNVNNYRKHI